MENKTEDEIRKRWEVEAKAKAEQEEQRPKKRIRAIEYQDLGRGPVDKSRAAAQKKSTRVTGGRGKTKAPDAMDDGVVELD